MRDGVSRLFCDRADSRPDKHNIIMISCYIRYFFAFEIDFIYNTVIIGVRSSEFEWHARRIADIILYNIIGDTVRFNCISITYYIYIIIILSCAYVCFVQSNTSETFYSSDRRALRIRRLLLLLLRRVARAWITTHARVSIIVRYLYHIILTSTVPTILLLFISIFRLIFCTHRHNYFTDL